MDKAVQPALDALQPYGLTEKALARTRQNVANTAKDRPIVSAPPSAGKPRRGRRRLDEGPALDRQRLTATLIALARTEGVEALNMRRVARELGVSARLLYHHVRNMDEMVELIADEITGLAQPDLEHDDWEQRLRSVVTNARRAYQQFREIGRAHV